MLIKLVSGKKLEIEKAECKANGISVKKGKSELFIPYSNVKYVVTGKIEEELKEVHKKLEL